MSFELLKKVFKYKFNSSNYKQRIQTRAFMSKRKVANKLIIRGIVVCLFITVSQVRLVDLGYWVAQQSFPVNFNLFTKNKGGGAFKARHKLHSQ